MDICQNNVLTGDDVMLAGFRDVTACNAGGARGASRAQQIQVAVPGKKVPGKCVGGGAGAKSWGCLAAR